MRRRRRPRTPARTARSARRSAERRRLRLSLATIRSSHGRNGAPVAEPRQGGVGLDEGVLDSIGGIGLRGDEVGSAQGDVLVAAHEGLVRRDVAGAGAADQFAVVQCRWPPRSTVPSTPRASIGSRPGGRLPSGGDHRTRLPPLDRAGSAGRGRGARLHHRDADRARVPRRRRRRHRRQRRPRPDVDRRGHGRAGRPARRTPTAAPSRPSRSRPTRRRSVATCRSTTRPSTRCRAARRRSRRRSSSPAPTTSRAASRTAGSSSRAGAATTATPWARSTCPAARRCAGRTRRGSGRFRHVSAAYPYRAGDPGATRSATAAELAAELERAIVAAGPGTVAAFVAEPIVGATLAAAVPPDDYWPRIAEVCRAPRRAARSPTR